MALWNGNILLGTRISPTGKRNLQALGQLLAECGILKKKEDDEEGEGGGGGKNDADCEEQLLSF